MYDDGILQPIVFYHTCSISSKLILSMFSRVCNTAPLTIADRSPSWLINGMDMPVSSATITWTTTIRESISVLQKISGDGGIRHNTLWDNTL